MMIPITMLTMMVITMMTGVTGVRDDVAVSSVFWEAVGEVSVGQLVTEAPESGLNQTCFLPHDNYSSLSLCLHSQCVSGDDVAKLYGVTSDQPLNASQLSRMSAGLVYVLVSQATSCSSEVYRHHESPSATSVWGYGVLFVTLINICSMLGACILPCVHTALYKVLLIFMVALAVGTLVGSGLLVLIPEALGLGEDGGQEYLWKMTTVMGGVYLFFLVERVMRYINNRREDTRDKKDQDRQAMQGTYTSFFQMHAPDTALARMKQDAQAGIRNCAFSDDGQQTAQSSGDLAVLSETDPADDPPNGQHETPTTTTTTANINNKPQAMRKSAEGGHSHGGGGPGSGERKKIAPVAYMVIFGDALHNFIDGLSIGAAFTESTLLGISLSVAVMCEELPHELGDFAILLNAGMSMRKALLYNFLSSLSCYVGLVIGIQLGENTHANTWIFAIAGGMFLYISLADMLPEMNSAAESTDGKEFGEVKTFLVQNLGLLCGFGIILLLAVYGEQISFE